MQGYKISTDKNVMDADAIHRFLTTSYWAKDIPRNTVEKAVNNSLCFGVFTYTNQQVGFARAITDSATFAYLADVYILQPHRGKGLGKWLISSVIEHPQLQGLRRILLATQDAHGLYQEFGFTKIAKPEKLMEILVPDVYNS